MTLACIAEIDLTRPDGTAETLFVSDTAILPFAHDDADRPNQVYRQRLKGPPAYAAGIHADPARLSGDVGAGVIDLINGDGWLSWVADCAVGEVRVLLGREGDPWASWAPLLTGRGEPAQRTLRSRQAGRVAIPINDLRAGLDRDVVTRTYLGTNNGPAGYEGGDDLKDAPAPLTLGQPFHVPGVTVNDPNRAYQWHDGVSRPPGTLYDRGDPTGLALVATADSAAFDGAALSATQYAADAARSLLRLGGSLGGELGFDARGPAGTDTAADAARWLLARSGVGSIGASLSGWASAAPIGAWWGGAVAYREALDLMARSAGVGVVPDRLGRWQLAGLALGAPVASISEGMVLDIGVDDPDLTAPVWEVIVRGRRNHLVLPRDRQAAAIRETDRGAFCREEWRQARAFAQATKDRWGDAARSVTIDTALTGQSDMQALADDLLALFGPRPDGRPRRSLAVTVAMTAAALAWPLGATLRLSYPREGIADDLALIGTAIATPRRDLMRLRLYG